MGERIDPPAVGRQPSVFEAVGGQEFFDELVDRFYAGVEDDEVLRPLYPRDLSDSRRHLALFLGQFWGGPTTYSQERGHPALRMRHAPFTIGPTERDAWLHHMRAALDSLVAERGTAPSLEAKVVDHLVNAADFLVNAR